MPWRFEQEIADRVDIAASLSSVEPGERGGDRMFSTIRMLAHWREALTQPAHLTMLQDVEIDPTKDTCEVCRFSPLAPTLPHPCPACAIEAMAWGSRLADVAGCCARSGG